MERKSCFIIMPFTRTFVKERELGKGELDFIYSEVIRKAVVDCHYKGKQVFTDIARYESNIGSIISGIANNLNTADLVIADLSGLNPNVMYELGVRHTLKRGTIIITQDIKSLASDLRDYTCIEYSFSNDNVIEQQKNYESFKINLHRAINEVFSTEKFDSPVLNYLAGKQRYWKEDQIGILKENIIIAEYVYDQFESIRELLKQIRKTTEQNNLLLLLGKCSAHINNLSNGLSDLNIPIETFTLYEDTQAAKQMIGEIQKKSALADYFVNYVAKLSEGNDISLESFKLSFLVEKYVDYFRLTEGDFLEISFEEIFSEEGDFNEYFIKGLEEYLEKRAAELGLSEEEINTLFDT